jgi:hypothetical protein
VDCILFDHVAISMPKTADAVSFLAGTLGGIPDSGHPTGVFRLGQVPLRGRRF